MTTRPVAATAYTEPKVIPAISQNRIESKVMGLPAHERSTTTPTKSATTRAAKVRRDSAEPS